MRRSALLIGLALLASALLWQTLRTEQTPAAAALPGFADARGSAASATLHSAAEPPERIGVEVGAQLFDGVATGLVLGRVVDSGGRPLPGVTIDLFEGGDAYLRGGRVAPESSTEPDDATFRVVSRRPGPTVLVATDLRDGASTRPATLVFGLAPGETKDLGEIVLDQGLTISGVVQLHPACDTHINTVRVVAEAWIQPAAHNSTTHELSFSYSASAGEREFVYAACDGLGRFTLRGLAPAGYKLSVDWRSFLTDSTLTPRLPIRVDATRTATAPAQGIVLLSNLRCVVFRTVNELGPLGNVDLGAYLRDTGEGDFQRTEEDGRVAVILRADRTWDISVRDPEFRGDTFTLDPATLPAGEVVDIPMEPSLPPGEILVRASGPDARFLEHCGIAVAVYESGLEPSSKGIPRTGASASIGATLRWEQRPRGVSIDRVVDGGAHLRGVPPGRYSILLAPRCPPGDLNEHRFVLPRFLDVDVRSNQRAVVNWPIELGALVQLSLTGADRHAPGEVWLETGGERIELDGRSAPASYFTTTPVPPGAFELVLGLEGVEQYRSPVRLERGLTTSVTIPVSW